MPDTITVDMIVRALEEGFDQLNQKVASLGSTYQKTGQIIVDQSGKIQTVTNDSANAQQNAAQVQQKALDEMSSKMQWYSNIAVQKNQEIQKAQQETARVMEQDMSTRVALLTQKYEENAQAAEWVANTEFALAGAFGAVATAGAALLAVTVPLAARVETLGIVTETLGRNVGMTADDIHALEKSVQNEGIEIEKSRQAIAMMIQANIDLSKATQLAKIAQDAAVIAGINSSEAFQKLVWIIQTGNVRMARQLGLMVLFDQAYKKFAEGADRTVESLSEQERVQIRTNAVIDAGANIADAYSRAMETAGKKVTSLTRHINNSRVYLGQFWLPVYAEAIDLLTAGLQKWEDASRGVKDFTAGTLGVITAVAAAEAALFTILGMITKVKLAWQALSGVQLIGAATLGGIATAVALPVAGFVALGAAIAALIVRHKNLEAEFQKTIHDALESAKTYEGLKRRIEDADKAAGHLRDTEGNLVVAQGPAAQSTLMLADGQKIVGNQIVDTNNNINNQVDVLWALKTRAEGMNAMLEKMDTAERRAALAAKLATAEAGDHADALYEDADAAQAAVDAMIMARLEWEHEQVVVAALAAGLRGELTDAINSYHDSLDRINEKQADLNEKLHVAERRYGKNSTKAKDLRDQIAGLAKDEQDAADALAEATAQMIYQQAAADLNADAALQLAQTMGLISDADYAVAIAVQNVRNKFDQNGDSILSASEAGEDYVKAIQAINTAVQTMETLDVPIDTSTLDLAMQDIDLFTQAVEELKKEGTEVTAITIEAKIAEIKQPELPDVPDKVNVPIEVDTSPIESGVQAAQTAAENLSNNLPDGLGFTTQAQNAQTALDEMIIAKLANVTTESDQLAVNLPEGLGFPPQAEAAQRAIDGITTGLANIPRRIDTTVNVWYHEYHTPGRQTGGPVAPGIPYKIHKDETVIFDTPGYVFPVGASKGMSSLQTAGGGGMTVYEFTGDVNVFPPPGSSPQEIGVSVVRRIQNMQRSATKSGKFHAGAF